MNTVRIYGHSDDLVEVTGSISAEFIRTHGGPTTILISDGTAIELEYDSAGIWRVVDYTASDEANIEVLPHDLNKMPNDYSEVAVVFLPEAPNWVGKASEHGISEREQAPPDYGGGLYQRMVGEFASKNNLDATDIESQWSVVEEEFEEMQEAFEIFLSELPEDDRLYDGRSDWDALAEEMADCIFTVHLAASMLGIDLRDAFREKAMHNLNKSGQRDANGKIIDDVSESEGNNE